MTEANTTSTTSALRREKKARRNGDIVEQKYIDPETGEVKTTRVMIVKQRKPKKPNI